MVVLNGLMTFVYSKVRLVPRIYYPPTEVSKNVCAVLRQVHFDSHNFN